MSYRCDLCGKGKQIGRNVSHAKNRTRKVSMPNLHRFNGFLPSQKGLPAGRQGHWLLCTKCLRKVKAHQSKLKAKREVLPADSPPKTASK